VKIWRGLRTRIVLGSILCGMLGLVICWAMTRRTVRDAIQSGFAPYVHRTLDHGELARCQRDPAHFTTRIGRGARLDAYDESKLASENRDSPPLDKALYRRLVSGDPNPIKYLRLGSAEATTMLVRAADSGPCALVQVTWPPHRMARRRYFYLMLTGSLVVMAVAAALGMFVVVQPLTRRIDKLRRAAGAVGSPDGYVSARDPASDEIGDLSASLDRAHARICADAETLEEKQRALERHLADIAHDLKTPMASLQIALEQATKQTENRDLSDLLKGSLNDVIYLNALTTNLRLACQLRDGWNPAEWSPGVDLGETVDRVVARARYFARNRGIALDAARPDVPVFASCHPTAVEQAITNLVENAIAYGDVGGHVAVVLEAGPKGFTLLVADDGPGVPPAEMPRLGERTFRTDEARQRDPSGSGLGLAITSEICKRCGWRLAFEPHEPRGLRVSIAGPTGPTPT
jgi:signal transduction histidine kinase